MIEKFKLFQIGTFEEFEQVLDHKINFAKHMRKHWTVPNAQCAPPEVYSTTPPEEPRPFKPPQSHYQDTWDGLKHEGGEVANGCKFDWKSLSKN